eukprot:829787-Amphidinium_carterae.4
MTARRARLEAAQRREVQHGNGQDAERFPKAPPQGVQVPASKAPLPQPTLNLQQLREKKQKKKNAYERQAAQQGIPEERVQQVQQVQVEVPEVPAEAEQVDSATTGSSTSGQSSHARRLQAVDDSDEYYWKNILVYMHLNYVDEKRLTSSHELHEGVLYYMNIEEIDDLLRRSQRGEPEAARKMQVHYTDMSFLEQCVQKQLEDRQGEIEESEEFITALNDKDDMKLKNLSYKYFEELRELRRQWKISKIEEDNRKKEEIRKAMHRQEEDRQNKKSEREEQEVAAAASSTPKARSAALPLQPSAASASMQPRKPMRRPPPVPLSQQLKNTMDNKRTPETPLVPLLSPRLRLHSHNFKHEKNKKTDAYYEKMLMQEIIQRSYIKHHPTSGYKTSTKEIRRVYETRRTRGSHWRTTTTHLWEYSNYLALACTTHRLSSIPSNCKNLTVYDIKDGKKINMNKFYRTPNYSSSTLCYQNEH